MNIERKLELARQQITSIATHDDALAAEAVVVVAGDVTVTLDLVDGADTLAAAVEVVAEQRRSGVHVSDLFLWELPPVRVKLDVRDDDDRLAA